MTEFSPQKPAERLSEFSFAAAGGLNSWDPSDQLMQRSHRQLSASAVGGFANVPRAIGGESAHAQAIWQQVAPMESPSLQNIEFFQDGWGTRLGSLQADDLTSVLLAGDTLFDGFEWQDPAVGGARILIVISAQTLYTNQSGSWAQLAHNDAAATPFTFGSTITKWMFSAVDGHLLISTDGATNRIRAYRSGAALDDPLGNTTATTTVNVDSSSGQKVLKIAATTSFQPGDRVRINSGGARDESRFVASVQAGTSLTFTENLVYAHTSVQADVVQVANRYVEAYATGTTHVITGAWTLGCYLGCAVRDVFAYSAGSNYLEYTPPARTAASGIWDVAGLQSGFYQARARIVGLASYVPDQGSINDQLLYIFTTAGAGVLTGFESYDQGMDMNRQLAGVPINHRCICATKGWLVYLTDLKDIEAINGKTVINLGRRMKNLQKTGPLDGLNLTQSALSAFVFYSIQDEKVYLQANSGSAGRVNDLQFVVDFRLGEPLLGEARTDYEQHVRCLANTILNPDLNAWFYGMFQRMNAGTPTVCGVTKDGHIYTVGGLTLPRNDLDTLAIPNYWDTPWFTSGQNQILLLIQNLISRFAKSGAWYANLDIFTNYGDTSVKTLPIYQVAVGDAVYDTAVYDTDTYTRAGTVMHLSELDLYEQAFKFRISNSQPSQYWKILSALLEYQPGERET